MIPNPDVLITFDDGCASVYTTAYPILAAAGFKATCYINSDTIGDTGYMTEDNLAELYAAGWDIANHSDTSNSLTSFTQGEQETKLSACADYLDGLGLTRASHHVAYPDNEYNADTLSAMETCGMLTGRTATATKQMRGTITPYELQGAHVLNPGRTLAAATALIATAAPGEVITYFGHQIADTETDAYYWTTAKFTGLVAYLASAGITPLTISEFYQRYVA